MVKEYNSKKLVITNETDIRRFWSRVNKEDGQGPGGDCWEWMGGKDCKGYGIMWFGDSQARTHRIAYSIYNGEVPKGCGVLHKCDNPSCVKKEHLFLGYPRDNVRDMWKKGRQNIVSIPKVESEMAEVVRHIYESGEFTIEQIASHLKVSAPVIIDILHHKGAYSCKSSGAS